MNEFKVILQIFTNESPDVPGGEPFLEASAMGNGTFPSLEWTAKFYHQAREQIIERLEADLDEEDEDEL